MDTAEKWDKSASDYQRTYKLGQSDYSTAMLRFWEEMGMLKNGMQVLDIGCGVGKYGVCFAERNCDVTLTDISGEMLRHASENMSGFDVPWRVYQCDFNEISGTEPVFSGGFDFSISTMSPAIHDMDTVRKMSAMTDGWCFLTRFIEWEQPNRDRLLLSLGLEPKPVMENMKEDCAALVRAISGEGYVPLVKYVEYNWSDERTPEQAAEYMLRNYISASEAPPAEEKVLEAARSLCGESGRFTDAVNTRVMWIYWNTKKENEMIHTLYEQAAELHGHKCPGLAIGVRAAVEAKRILEIENIQDKELYCVAENSACYIDGIQALLGCTFGKGNLIYRYTGKTAFTFYHNSAGKSLRLVMREMDFSGGRDAMTEYILTAPMDKVFYIGRPRFELPPTQEHSQRIKCALCGELTEEHTMRVKNGQIVCTDCAEQAFWRV